MESSMLGKCLRSLIVLLSLVAVAAFAGHGTAMAIPGQMGMPGYHGAAGPDAAAHADGHAGHAGQGAAKAAADGMSCCGKSCASLLPFPQPPQVAERLPASDPIAAVSDARAGVLPPGLKRPPKSA